MVQTSEKDMKKPAIAIIQHLGIKKMEWNRMYKYSVIINFHNHRCVRNDKNRLEELRTTQAVTKTSLY